VGDENQSPRIYGRHSSTGSKEYGGMEVDQVRRLKELEQENGRLKRLVADQALDISILNQFQR